ncbi:hypothetical protein ACLOJK_019210, partial [Asimina triloba]
MGSKVRQGSTERSLEKADGMEAVRQSWLRARRGSVESIVESKESVHLSEHKETPSMSSGPLFRGHHQVQAGCAPFGAEASRLEIERTVARETSSFRGR